MLILSVVRYDMIIELIRYSGVIIVCSKMINMSRMM